MTRQELEQQYLVVDEAIFTPRYDYKQIEVIENGEPIFIDDYSITATAQEVYNEWLAQQNQPSIPSEQDKVNASLMLEIAKLKAKVGTV